MAQRNRKRPAWLWVAPIIFALALTISAGVVRGDTGPYYAYLPFISSSSDCGASGGSGGLAPGIYRTNVAGLDAIVVVGQGYSPNKATHLGFHIHGDGGDYDKFVKSGNPVTQFVNARGWILVSPLAPNGQSWWRDWIGDHNDKFAAVLDEMFAKYNVCRNRVFGSSGSGGSEFWTAYFFPEKGGQYPAHTVISCGGNDGHSSQANQQITNLGKNPTVVARSTFYYVYCTADNLLPTILQSIDKYRSAGFRVDVVALQGAGHCNKWEAQGFPTQSDQIVMRWTEIAARLGVQ